MPYVRPSAPRNGVAVPRVVRSMPESNVAHIGGRPISGHDRPSRAFKANRVCQEPGCGTRLSIYNKGKFCYQHEPHSAPPPRGRKTPGPHTVGVMLLAAANPWIYWLSFLLVFS